MSDSKDPRQLDVIQRWFQSVITHPDGIEAGVESDDARAEIDVSAADVDQVVTRSERLDSAGRIGIYANAYFARLLECLRESFPAMVHALGEETFDQFSFGYLQTYPSTSYTLEHLSNHFAQHLDETRPDREARDRGNIDWPDFLIDLATLEITIGKVFDGPGAEKDRVLTAEDLQAIPPEVWPTARLVPVPCLRLLAFSFPVNSYFTAYRNDEEPEIPAPQPEFVAINRRDYVVRRIPLSEPQYHLLEHLLAGATIGEAITAVAESGTIDVEQFAAELQEWFAGWTAARFFRSVELP